MTLLGIFGENFLVLIILVLCLSLLGNEKQRPRGSRAHASILSFLYPIDSSYKDICGEWLSFNE